MVWRIDVLRLFVTLIELDLFPTADIILNDILIVSAFNMGKPESKPAGQTNLIVSQFKCNLLPIGHE